MPQVKWIINVIPVVLGGGKVVEAPNSYSQMNNNQKYLLSLKSAYPNFG